jgi:hypothetical protein
LSATSTALFYRALLVVALLCAPAAVRADVFRPAYLELRETGADQYDVLWKVPAQGELRLAMAVRFPDGTTNVTEPRSVMSGTASTERWRVQRTGGLVGQTIGIDGLPGGVTDVVVRVERADGSTQVERLAPARPEFRVTAPAGISEIAWSYLVLGVEHILGGIDHLLFVLALLLIVQGRRRMLATITASVPANAVVAIDDPLACLPIFSSSIVLAASTRDAPSRIASCRRAARQARGYLRSDAVGISREGFDARQLSWDLQVTERSRTCHPGARRSRMKRSCGNTWTAIPRRVRPPFRIRTRSRHADAD